jgi:DNA modification methylase
MSWTIHHGDCREVMATLDAESVDAIVSDPPYFLGFMNKGWDKQNPKALDCDGLPGSRGHGRKPGESSSIARQNSIASYNVHLQWAVEALRVAKPGAHLLAFGGTRTYHRLACAIEDAGWEIRDCVMWVYGSGFPKSHNVANAIDKSLGCGNRGRAIPAASTHLPSGKYASEKLTSNPVETYSARTPQGEPWQGWGTALKPAWEPIIVARKPLVGTVADNVLRHGTGGINVDGCRVHSGPSQGGRVSGETALGQSSGWNAHANRTTEIDRSMESGRWPANLIHDGSEEVVGLFPANVKGGTWNRTDGARHFNNDGEPTDYQTSGSDSTTGSAARFFYCAKASKADRDEGCEGLQERAQAATYGDLGAMEGNPRKVATGHIQRVRNHHPTVKPTALMRYLCRLVTPPGGVVLDPFTGSGSTGKGAVLEGFRFIGIEREAEYVEIAKARIAAATPKGTLF